MSNKTSAKEWLTIAYHDLKSAQILFENDHYTDSIGNDLQQAVEKILKSLIAYDNKQIKKSHDLVEVYNIVGNKIQFDNKEMEYLEKATTYSEEDRYPNSNYSLPPKEDIREILEFTKILFRKVCKILDVDKDEVMK